MSIRILNGDCRTVLADLPAESVHCCVTSPPYFGLRDYGHAGQIGLEQTPAEYVEQLVQVFREVRRVLRDDGTLFLNLGDSYVSSGGQRKYGSSDGAMGRGDAPSRRVIACGTSGTAPASSTAHGCLCGSLCDACRRAYRFGKSHTDGLRAPMPSPSLLESIPAHTGSDFCRPPTLDSTAQADRSEVAILPAQQAQGRECEPLPASPASTTGESSRQHLEAPHLSAPPSECHLCGRSFERCAPVSVHSLACTCGIGSPSGASDSGMSGIASSDSAFLDLTTASLKPKDLIGIPWRVAFALQADGWYLRQDIIWSKPNPMPESVTDRCTKAHEYVFLLSKSPRYFYDADAVAEPVTESTFARLSQNVDAQQGSARVPGKTNGAMKAVGRSKRDSFKREDSKRAEVIPGQTVGTHRPDREECAYPLDTRNRRSVWTIATQPFKEAHFATMAPGLAETCIKAGCPIGGTVLDPFGGAGTTGLVADRLQRDAVLVELNPEYIQIARERITGDAPLFAEVA